MTKVTFTVTVDIDPSIVELEAKRRGYSLERAAEALISDLENRLNGSIRWRAGVEKIGIALPKPTAGVTA